jgi:hypothetical protein
MSERSKPKNRNRQENNMDGETDPALDFPHNPTLRGIFDRNKKDALENAIQLVGLIREIALDCWFGEDVEATEDNRPMPALKLAKKLCDQLLTLEHVKIISSDW